MSTTERPSTEHGPDEHLPQPHPVAGEGVEREPGAGGRVLRAVVMVAVLVGLAVFVSPWVLLMIVAIVVSIFLHEVGHYWTAKRSGMKVTEFFLFFGPKIWSFQRGETEFGIKCIPLGAYVKIVGMNNLEEVDPADEPRTFRQKRYGPRMAVVLAGVTVNLILGFGLIYAFLLFQGTPRHDQWSVASLSTAEDVARYDQDIAENAALTEAFRQGESPAEQAGLQVGDRIVAVDGIEVETFADVGDVIQQRPGETVDLVLVRDGERIEASTTLGTLSDGNQERGFLGFGPSRLEFESVNALEAVPETFSTFTEMVTQSATAFARVFTPEGVSSIFDNATSSTSRSSAPEDAPAPIPGADRPEERRVVSIFGATYLGAQLAEENVVSALMFLAFLNVFLAVVNLVPLLPFDGGHAVVATYERIREAQLHQRRYLADVGKLLPLTYGVFLILMVLATLTIFPDIINPPQLQ